MSLTEFAPLAGAALANVGNSPWTDERIEALKRLWGAEDHLTAREIADEIGGFEYCDDGGKNAVIGKARRLKLKAHAKSPSPRGTRKPRAKTRHIVTRLRKVRAEAKERQAVEVAPEAAPAIFCATPCSLLELTDENCHWPIGDPGQPDFHFCGGKASAGTPYCGYHGSVAYQPPAARRDRRPARA